MDYQHTQRGPLTWLLGLFSLLLYSIAFMTSEQAVTWGLCFGATLMLGLGLSFGHLSVQSDGQELLVAFGPLPLFKRRIPLSEIKHAARARSALIEGWGIHLRLGGGWVWNIWGRECVDVAYGERGMLRIGTDDAANLERYLQSQLSS